MNIQPLLSIVKKTVVIAGLGFASISPALAANDYQAINTPHYLQMGKVLHGDEVSDQTAQVVAQEARNFLGYYHQLLLKQDVDGIAKIWTQDGLLMMPTWAVASKSNGLLQKDYTAVFNAITIDSSPEFMQINVLTPTHVIVTLNAIGIETVKKTGERHLDPNREIFILAKINGEWKIQYYMFNQRVEEPMINKSK
ncbi:MAG TPA: hypothetical protein VGV92_02755 [Gammaproteobacteria bacterium]|nr:hypothetical protein [Gammaproteobacteria bacterium]